MGMSDYFIFGDIDTRDYEGIYVYFDDIDATPSRVGEFIEIPGRNGSFYLDKGRYEDVTHTYDIIALTMEAGRDLINAISSQVGYHRLEDSFNPDEFYSAVFTSEVEPTVPTDRDQMTFKLMFTRKPQRWLTSGETPVTIASSGDTITNPTLFESGPLLEVEGYGNIEFNGFEIALENETFGDVTVLDETTRTQNSFSFTFAKGLYNLGDTIEIKKAVRKWVIVASEYYAPPAYGNHSIGDVAVSDSNLLATTTAEKIDPPGTNRGRHVYSTTFSGLTFTAGTYTTITDTITASVDIVYWNGGSYVSITTETLAPAITIKYESLSAAEDMITFSFTNAYDLYSSAVSSTMETSIYGPVIIHSTFSMLGNPTFIDCDIGEAYKIENDSPISLNQYIDLGSKLPILAPGSNTITFDNTITDLKVTPRWWRV